MRRIAAHYIFKEDLLHLHYIEIDDHNNFVGVFPLSEEIAGTEFYDGVVFPSHSTDLDIDSLDSLKKSGVADNIKKGNVIDVYQLREGLCSSTKLTTNKRSCNSNIK
jgi:hypothetical protein